MQRLRSRPGQTLVELAMILPLLLAIIMAIIDFSYLVYSWAEVQFAARRGAEQAQKLPPENLAERTLANPQGDECEFDAIRAEVYKNGSFSKATGLNDNEVTIRFYKQTATATTDPAGAFTQTSDPNDREIGTIVELEIIHPVPPLTPLGQTLFGNDLRTDAASRRSITSLASDLSGCS